MAVGCSYTFVLVIFECTYILSKLCYQTGKPRVVVAEVTMWQLIVCFIALFPDNSACIAS